MARRRAARSIPRRGRPTGPRGPQSRPAPRGRGRPTPRGRGRPSPRGPQPLRDLRPGGSSRSAPRGRGRPSPRRRPGAQKNRATRPTINVADLRRKAGTLPPKNFVDTMPRTRSTGRPPIDPGQQLRNFMNNMPRPRVGGPQEGINLANRAIALPRRGGRAAARAAGDPRSFMNPRQAAQFNRSRGIGNVPQRPIPNRDGRLAQMQAALARQASIANAAAARRPSIMGSMDPRRGTFGKAFDPRPMPQSNYARQPMPAQQIQRGMGRGPMARGNIGQVQAPRPTFGQQMRPSILRRRR